MEYNNISFLRRIIFLLHNTESCNQQIFPIVFCVNWIKMKIDAARLNCQTHKMCASMLSCWTGFIYLVDGLVNIKPAVSHDI